MTAAFVAAGGAFLLYQGAKYGYLRGVTEYDDGVYYGSSVMLLHGLLPYRSFVDVQPPGIVVATVPFALLGRLTSTATGFEWARIFIILVSMANLALVGRLLRQRPTIALIAGLAVFGFYEDTLVAEHTVLLEPLLIFFTLLGFTLVFGDTERVGTSTRWLLAGLMFGAATSVKLWGILPLAVVAVLALRSGRSGASRLLAGAVVGFGVICLPFFASAPWNFFHEVVVDQAVRQRSGEALATRLALLLGANSASRLPGAVWALGWVGLAAVVAGSIVLAGRRRPRPPLTQLDICAMACMALVLISLIGSPQFFPHYGAFLAPFLGLVVSATVVRMLPLGRVVVAAVVLVGAVAFTVHSMVEVTPTAAPSMTAALDRAFPPGTCLLSRNNSELLLANRFSLTEPGCPHVVDWFGSEFQDADGSAADRADATNTRVQDDWLAWLHQSNGLILDQPPGDEPDFGEAVRSYIGTRFRAVASVPGLGTIYRRDRA